MSRKINSLRTALTLVLSFASQCQILTVFAQTGGTPDKPTILKPLTTPAPSNPLEHNNRAVELGSRGRWVEALKEHDVALAGDPQNEMFKRNLSGAHLRYADILARKKHYKQAIKHYSLALSADLNNGPADTNLDKIVRRIGKNPESIEYWHGVAEKALKRDELSLAITALHKCTRLSDQPSYSLELGRVLTKNGQSESALSELRRAAAKFASAGDKKGEQECNDLLQGHKGNHAPVQLNDFKNKFLWDDRR